MIRFFNTLSGKVEEFKPLKAGEVGMYTCGPTVYDYAHIGNFRTFVFEDLLRRFLEYKGFEVKHVMNLTDVDDKTIAGAKREGKKLEDFTRTYTEAFFEDLKTLNILLPNHPIAPPRATREIGRKGVAYVKDGSVYYRIASFPQYGRLSKKKLEKNLTGARVDVDEYDKEAGADFALWKKSKEGEPAWDSPWGKGRPGWHIECSAMSMKYLGETFDIHAGGEDLIFPHHENEIAQSEAATGKQFVKYWLHAKHLIVDGEKMSKSKGNFYTLRDLTKDYDPMAIRYALLSVHYRQPLNFTLTGLREAEQTMERLRNCYAHCFNLKNFGINFEISGEEQKNWNYDLPTFEKYIKEGMDSILEGAFYPPTGFSDDLNISYALSSVHDIVKHINFRLAKKLLDYPHLDIAISFFKNIDRLLGLRIADETNVPPPEVLELQENRDAFRRSSEFIKNPELQRQSDQIRAKIQTLGWDVKDGRPGEPSIIRKKAVKQKV